LRSAPCTAASWFVRAILIPPRRPRTPLGWPIPLTAKKMVVIGGNRGGGRRLEAGSRSGAGARSGAARGFAPVVGRGDPRHQRFWRSMPRTKCARKSIRRRRAGYPGVRGRVSAGRAAPRVELRGVRRQEGVGRQDRISLLQGNAVAAGSRRLGR